MFWFFRLLKEKIEEENIYPFSFLSNGMKYEKCGITLESRNKLFQRKATTNLTIIIICRRSWGQGKIAGKKGFGRFDFKWRTVFPSQGTATMSLRIPGSSNVKLWLGLLIVPCWPFWVVARGQTRFPPPFCCFNSIPSAGDDLPITSRDVWKPGVFGPANRNDFPVSL